MPLPRITIVREHAADGSLCWRGEVSVYGGTCCEIVLYATALLVNEHLAMNEARAWLRGYLQRHGARNG